MVTKTGFMMEVAPRIIKSFKNHGESRKILLEKDPYKRIEIAGKILQSELLDGSELYAELNSIQKEMDASQDIDGTWGRPLNLLELQIELSRESCYLAGNNTISTRTYMLETILRIQGRGCHLASEISHLLKGGYPDGAEARWRTLNELEIIALFISDKGEDAAKRYYNYQAVEMQRFYRSVKDHYSSLARELTEDERNDYTNAEIMFNAASNDVKVCCSHFGPNFKNRYGWASDALGKKEPNFTDIMKEVDSSSSRLPHNSANFAVHGGPRATLYRRGLPHPEFILMGPSKYGLKDVINNTAVSLEVLTRVLMIKCGDDTVRAIYDFQYAITDEIMKWAEIAEKELGMFRPHLNPNSQS